MKAARTSVLGRCVHSSNSGCSGREFESRGRHLLNVTTGRDYSAKGAVTCVSSPSLRTTPTSFKSHPPRPAKLLPRTDPGLKNEWFYQNKQQESKLNKAGYSAQVKIYPSERTGITEVGPLFVSFFLYSPLFSFLSLSLSSSYDSIANV